MLWHYLIDQFGTFFDDFDDEIKNVFIEIPYSIYGKTPARYVSI